MIAHLLKRASIDEKTHKLAKMTAANTALKTAQVIVRLPPEIKLLLLTMFPSYSALPLFMGNRF